MNKILRVLAALLLTAALVALAGCNKLQARDQLNKGVESFKNARYEEAIEHFKNAVGLDPSLLNARIYLATAYAQLYVPGAETPDNQRYADQAIAQYKDVLHADPGNINSVKGIAYLYLQEKQFDQAKQYYQRAAQIDPSDPEADYSIAYIDFWLAHDFRQQERDKLGMKATEPLQDKAACDLVKQHNAPMVEEGIGLLNKALALRHDYDDAMDYMNLMYRERADFECDDPRARAADLKTAGEWFDKTNATKREKANRQLSGGGAANPQGQ
jgi:tetratricopeptide (TPR) repeat protein